MSLIDDTAEKRMAETRNAEVLTTAWAETTASLFERELVELAATFVGLSADVMDTHVEKAIGRVAEFFDLDRATMGQRPPEGGALRITHQWVRAGCARIGERIPEEAAPWITSRIAGGESVVFSRPEDLPSEPDQEFMRRIGTRSNATFPLIVADRVMGWLAFGALREERGWPPLVVEQLQLVAQLIGNALGRKQAELALRRAVDFERLLTTLSATFVHLRLDAMDRKIVETIAQVANFLGADRANILKHVPAERVFVRTHHWAREGVAPMPAPVPEEAVPWQVARAF